MLAARRSVVSSHTLVYYIYKGIHVKVWWNTVGYTLRSACHPAPRPGRGCGSAPPRRGHARSRRIAGGSRPSLVSRLRFVWPRLSWRWRKAGLRPRQRPMHRVDMLKLCFGGWSSASRGRSCCGSAMTDRTDRDKTQSSSAFVYPLHVRLFRSSRFAGKTSRKQRNRGCTARARTSLKTKTKTHS